MHKRMVLISLVTFTFCSANATEADGLLSQQFENCNSKAVSPVDIHGCIGSEIKLQDARLNVAYKAVLADVTPARAKQLLEAQRSWIKFRDANCNFYLDPEGGTIAPVRAGLCEMNLTASRAKELEDYLKP